MIESGAGLTITEFMFPARELMFPAGGFLRPDFFYLSRFLDLFSQLR